MSRRFGVLAKWHLVDGGLGQREWRRLRDGDEFELISRRVMRAVASPSGPEQDAAVGVFDAGKDAALSRDSALAWYGVPGFQLGPRPEVTRRHRTRPLATSHARVYDSRYLPAHHVIEVRGLPVVSPARLLLEHGALFCASHRHEFGAERLLGIYGHLRRARLVCAGDVQRMVDEVSEHGRAGMGPLRLLLERLPDDADTGVASSLESRLAQLLRRSGRAGYRAQRTAVSERGWLGRPDFTDVERAVVIEANSLEFHAGPGAVAADVARYRAFIDSGLSVVAAWEADIWQDPESVLHAVALAERSRSPILVHTPSMPTAWAHAVGQSDVVLDRGAVRTSYRIG